MADTQHLQQLQRIERQLKRIADALEAANKIAATENKVQKESFAFGAKALKRRT